MAGFGSMGAQERIGILVYLEGTAKFLSDAHAEARAVDKLAREERKLALAQKEVHKRSFLQNQALFTLRRSLFYTTLGVVGLGLAVIKMGFQYNSAMQTARVGLRGFIEDPVKMEKALQRVFLLAAQTPFTFQPIMQAVRRFMPVIGNFQKSFTAVQTVADALAGMGVTTDVALQRATLQLTHMFNVGHLTGQMLQNLGRDNIPLMEALKKEYHKTGEEIRHMISTGQVSAKSAMEALTHYTHSVAGFRDAAVRQSTQSFAAAWATFTDLIRIASGGASIGIFQKAQKALIATNAELAEGIKTGKVSLNELAIAMDKSLTPNTHTLAYTFFFLRGMVEGVLAPFIVFFKVTGALVTALGHLGIGTIKLTWATRALGWIIGILITLLVAEKVAMFLSAEMTHLKELRVKLLEYATIATMRVVGFFTALLYGESAALFESGVAMSWSTKMALRLRMAIMWLAFFTTGLISLLWAEVTAWWASIFVMADYEAAASGVTVSVYLMNGAFATLVRFIYLQVIPAFVRLWLAAWPIAVVAVILIGLYELWHRWKAFRDFIKENWKFGLLYLIPVIGEFLFMSVMIYKYWHQILGVIRDIVGLIPKTLGKIWHRIRHPFGGESSIERVLNRPAVKARAQHGGRVPRLSDILVGERGPEIMRLPGGSIIQPIGAGVGGVGNIRITVVPQSIYLDGRKIGSSVAQAYADVEARR